MSDLIQELKARYVADRTTLLQDELDLLCVFDSEVRNEQSQVWRDRLQVLECEYRGIEVTATPAFAEDANRVLDALSQSGFENVRTYVSARTVLKVHGNRRRWLDSTSQKSQTLHQQITQYTGIAPLFVSWFAGEIVIDLRSDADADIVSDYLSAQVVLNHQHLIRDRDPLLSLDIIRLKIKDSLTERTLEA